MYLHNLLSFGNLLSFILAEILSGLIILLLLIIRTELDIAPLNFYLCCMLCVRQKKGVSGISTDPNK